MISLNTLLIYISSVVIISATPGPNMLLAMTSGIKYGLRPIWPTMLGAVGGVITILCLSMSGLGAILKSSQELFSILKWVGAVYLIYLGIKMWRDRSAPVDTTEANASANLLRAPSFWVQFRMGVGVALSNPKAILFGLAFFPQFIDPNTPLIPQAAILLSIFAMIELSSMCVYALGGTQMSRFLASPIKIRRFNRVSGSVFILAGLGLGLFGKSK